MRRPSCEQVFFDASAFTEATYGERRGMLHSILDVMRGEDESAGIVASTTAYWLTRELTPIDHTPPLSTMLGSSETSHGILNAQGTLGLLNNWGRLRGYITAIRRWPQQEGVIDVGCGPFPVLALAAAAYHPKAEVTAVEINPHAAQVAQDMVGLFGLQSRVHVRNVDIAEHTIDPNTTAAVTETFMCALQREPGPRIVRLLHDRGVPRITPCVAELELAAPGGAFRFSQQIDLRRDTHADIGFDLPPEKKWLLGLAKLRASYSDEQGLVVPYGADTISRWLPDPGEDMLRDELSASNGTGRLRYELGARAFEPWVL